MGNASFPRQAKLRHPDDFRAVFRDGRRFVRSGLVVIAAVREYEGTRLGLALAKRRIPRAVDRNRVKRVVRESFRCSRQGLGDMDVVVLGRNGTGTMSNERLFKQLSGIWLDIAAAGNYADPSRHRGR